MKRTFTLLLSALLLAVGASTASFAQKRTDDIHRFDEIYRLPVKTLLNIPNINGLQTLKCDFHIHTIFSDGEVLPRTRVNEAWADGLDAIAITDHIEYRPYIKYVDQSHNTAADLAIEAAKELDLIVIRGAEISRKKPFGHMNALFITDADKFAVEDQMESLQAALDQDAFVILNHPGYPDNKTELSKLHKELIKEGKLHGVEVYNFITYYHRAVEWMEQYGLTAFANSDIHTPIYETFYQTKMSRPITLVFAKERSEAGIREALEAGNTLAWGNERLYGRADLMEQMVRASLSLKSISESGDRVIISNPTDLSFTMGYDDKYIVIPANNAVITNFPADGVVQMRNCLVGLNEALTINWKE